MHNVVCLSKPPFNELTTIDLKHKLGGNCQGGNLQGCYRRNQPLQHPACKVHNVKTFVDLISGTKVLSRCSTIRVVPITE